MISIRPEWGRLIVFDGGEGSGKDTVLGHMKREFADTIFSFEPGGTPYADEIRKVILCDKAAEASPNTLFALYLAARSDHSEKLIRPALSAGKNVILNRFKSSTFAYQIWAQGGHHLRPAFDLYHEIICGDFEPYLYVYLDVDPEEGARRTQNRGDANHFDRRKTDFHARVREGYLHYIADRPHCVVDANRPLEIVIADCLKILHSALD